MGPTASGKTELAIALAERLPCEIISVDSAMVYRGMDIGTAKPSRNLRNRVPHHLIDIRDPADPYSAAQFRVDALREMVRISAEGRIPLLVGGTMLYFRALSRGLSDLPGADRQVRAWIDGEARILGWPALHARLAGIDPEAGSRIHPHDTQRIQRALEVYELTGLAVTELYARSAAKSLPYKVIRLALASNDKESLHERIACRLRSMLQQGLVEEVEGLRLREDLDLHKPALRAVGYRQVWRHLEGIIDCDEMVKGAIVSTRQLAKRQLTWLRSEQNTTWFDSLDKDLFEKVLNHCAGSCQYARG